MSYFVYIMTNAPNGTLYVGLTNDIGRRVWEHKRGDVEGFTSQHKLDRLVHYETFDSIDEAIWREKRLKTWLRAWKVRLIQKTNPNWDDLSERGLLD